MTDDRPREYDRQYERPLPGPLRIRVGRDVDRGEVTRFVVQFEYAHDDGWHEVVRYDHDCEGSVEATHDVTTEGLHIDIYRDGARSRRRPFSAEPRTVCREVRGMARDTEGPMTEDELAAASDAIQELREEVRDDLADDLGGEPDDYRADRFFSPADDADDETGEALPDGGE
jgi:hypothetical protein